MYILLQVRVFTFTQLQHQVNNCVFMIWIVWAITVLNIDK